MTYTAPRNLFRGCGLVRMPAKNLERYRRSIERFNRRPGVRPFDPNALQGEVGMFVGVVIRGPR